MKLIEQVVSTGNMQRSYKSVFSNKGAAGVDGMKLESLLPYLTRHWESTKEQILTGFYLPQAILGVIIPKDNGGERLLGIPTVIDRLMQQSIHQVLSPLWEKEFSTHSYGFRPNKNAQKAILQAQNYINNGYVHIVDIDLKQFFDKVNHDYLMHLVKQKVNDPILLRLIWRYLRSPMQLEKCLRKRRQGVPQGGPLSPLLSNIVLDNLDKELERRGVRFVRYADDFSLFVRSKRAANRLKSSITKFIKDKLHLEVNEAKSQICRPSNYQYLGYAFVPSYKKGARGIYQLVVGKTKLVKLKQELKRITRKTIPMSFDERIQRIKQVMYGWLNYFKYASIQAKMAYLDVWLRCRLRYCIWSRCTSGEEAKQKDAQLNTFR